MSFPRPGEAGLEQVVRAERREALGQLALDAVDACAARDGGAEIVVNAARRDTVEERERADVGIEERELIATPIEPDEIKAGVHQAADELPNRVEGVIELHSDFEEVDLGDLTRLVDERDEDLSGLSAEFTQTIVNGGLANRETFFNELAMEAAAGGPLLASGARPPLIKELANALIDLFMQW